MGDVLAVVLWWQVLILVGWGVSRRLGRLERSLRPPCYAQLGALRQQVIAARDEQATDLDELMRRTRAVEQAVAQLEDELRELVFVVQRTSRALLERMRQLERQPGRHGAGESMESES
jgi:hypothetical protein